MSLTGFERLDVTDLIINIYWYNSKQNQEEEMCQRYNDLSVQALRPKWQRKWGSFDCFVEKLKRNDKDAELSSLLLKIKRTSFLYTN